MGKGLDGDPSLSPGPPAPVSLCTVGMPDCFMGYKDGGQTQGVFSTVHGMQVVPQTCLPSSISVH